MIAVILTIHVLIVAALIGLVLLQRSEGGALGIGGGGGGGFMSGRGAANVLTRSTSILAALFFATSLGLAIIADRGETDAGIASELTGADPDKPVDGEPTLESIVEGIGGGLGTTGTDAENTELPIESGTTDGASETSVNDEEIGEPANPETPSVEETGDTEAVPAPAEEADTAGEDSEDPPQD